MLKSREEPHEVADAPGGAGVRIGPLAGLPAVLRDLDCDPGPLFRGAGFDPEQFKDPDHVISFRAGSRLLARCVEATGCESLGLLLGERSTPSLLGLAGFILRTAPDVGSALRSLLRHLDLHDQGGVATFEVSGGVAMFGYAIHQRGVQATDQIYDLSIVMVCNIMRDLCGARWNPGEVLLCRAAPKDPRPYQRIFRAPIAFDAQQSAIVFASAWLDHRVPNADPLLHRHPEREAEHLHTRHRTDLATELRQTLRRMLLTQECSVARAAAQLRIHERTLNRRLRAQGTCFQRELDSTRFEMVRYLLGETSMSLAQTAEALAYADPTAFSRAFKRWSGITPTEWRAGRAKG